MSSKPRRYSNDWQTPTSVGVWGGSRAARLRLSLAIARRIDREFFWLQVVGDAESHGAPEPSLTERVPAGHLFYVRPPPVAPQTRLQGVAEWFAREDVPADARLLRIGELLGLPSLARGLVAGGSAGGPTRALVIADANLAETFFPLEEGGIRPFLEACNQYRTTLMITLGNRPNPNSRDIDYLLYIRPGVEDRESDALIECRQGPAAGTPGLFAQGGSRALNALVEELRRGSSAAPTG
jgi:hypothetical protein